MNNRNPAHKENALVEILSLYFSQRANFLAQVILADIVNSPYLPTKNSLSVQPQASANQMDGVNHSNSALSSLPTGKNGHSGPNENGMTGSAIQNPLAVGQTNGLQSAPSHSGNTPLGVETEQAKVAQPPIANDGQGAPAPAAAQPQAVKAILIDLIVERTGFPAASIKPDFRLLDDLNLDSIKSAELVAQTAKQIGVEGQVDPAYFANATLAEVAEALERLASFSSKLVQTSEQPEATVSDPSVNRVPQMLTLPADESPAWVRNFVVEYVAEDAASISSQEEEWQNTHLFPRDDWETAQVLIVAASSEADVVRGFSDVLQQKGAKVQVVSFVEMNQRSLIQSPDFTHFIAILPRHPQEKSSSGDRLQQAM